MPRPVAHNGPFGNLARFARDQKADKFVDLLYNLESNGRVPNLNTRKFEGKTIQQWAEGSEKIKHAVQGYLLEKREKPPLSLFSATMIGTIGANGLPELKMS